MVPRHVTNKGSIKSPTQCVSGPPVLAHGIAIEEVFAALTAVPGVPIRIAVPLNHQMFHP